MRLYGIFLFVFFISAFAPVYAQSNKKAKLNKGTPKRKLKKQQKAVYEEKKDENTFNPVQIMGKNPEEEREDFFWNSESANTVNKKAGNISITTPSRYGINHGLELSAILGLEYWVPNVSVKKRWYKDKFILSSRHGLYTGTPGFHWAQKNEHYDLVDSLAEIPFVLSIGNEVLISYTFYKNKLNCVKKEPYVILTLSGGVDFGISFGDSTLSEINHHFLTNRSPALTGQGVDGYFGFRGDWKALKFLYLSTSLKFFFGNFTGNFAFENKTEVQVFPVKNFSVSIGYWLSLASYNTPSNAAILPTVDLSWYFGKKEGRQKGLFENKLF